MAGIGSCCKSCRKVFKYSFIQIRQEQSSIFLVMLPRGIRNNNPLNIRRSKDQWKGLSKTQNDRSFCQFESLEYGWRAAFYLLTRTYYHKYRLYTIRGIVSRWAPSSENNTEAYIANVARLTGIAPRRAAGHPQRQAQPLDDGGYGNGDTRKWHIVAGSLRHAKRLGTCEVGSVMYDVRCMRAERL